VPGCIGVASTLEEAFANAAEALGAHFALMQCDGEEIPLPRTFEELRRDREFRDDSAGAIVTVVQPQQMPDGVER
jgi:hypothetical protein